MAVFAKFTFVLLLGVFSTFGEPNPRAPCDEECSKHEYNDTNNGSSALMEQIYRACSSGCTFYNVISSTGLNVKSDIGITTVKSSCDKSCDDAYIDTIDNTLIDSCKNGCTIQDVAKQAALAEKDANKEAEGGIHLSQLRPVMQIREITTKVLGMMRIVQSSVTMFFMKEDDQKLVAVQGPIEIVMEEIPVRERENMHSDLPMLPLLKPANMLPQFLSGDNQPEAERVTLDNMGSYPEVHAVREVPSVSVLMKYTIASGLATMIVVSLGLMLCMITPTMRRKAVQKEAMMAPPLPIKDNQLMVKVIRTEDLTKLSLDEDEKTGNKIGIKMPESSQI